MLWLLLTKLLRIVTFNPIFCVSPVVFIAHISCYSRTDYAGFGIKIILGKLCVNA